MQALISLINFRLIDQSTGYSAILV